MFGLSEISWLQFLAFATVLLACYNLGVFVYFKFLKRDANADSDYLQSKFAGNENQELQDSDQ